MIKYPDITSACIASKFNVQSNQSFTVSSIFTRQLFFKFLNKEQASFSSSLILETNILYNVTK